MKVNEIRADVTAKLIKLMQSGNSRPWRQPWTFGPNSGAPTSAASGKMYRGGNALTLDLVSMIEGYKSKNWNTFAGWRQHGVFPKQGSKGTWGLWYGGRMVDDGEPNEDGETKGKWQPALKAFVVFNAEQCHGNKLVDFLVPPPDPDSPALAVNYDAFDAMIQRLQVTINHNANSACHHVDSGKIDMPARGYFSSHEVYYSTLAHELTHWADRKSGNTVKSVQGSTEYAFNELVAEIGSAYLLRELGLPATETAQTDENAAIYLGSWIKALKNDDRYIFKAAARASKLVDFMVGRVAVESDEKELVTA